MPGRLPYHLLLLFSLFIVSCRDARQKNLDEYAVWGIDVSKHQSSIEWDDVLEKERPHFVFVKATEGSMITDNMYESHREKLESSGTLWGAYHFFGHRTPGKDQAANFIRTAKLRKGNLRPVLDIEWHRFFEDRKKMVREAKAFCSEMRKEYGVDPIIYCSSRFYDHHLREDFPDKNYVIWIANYSGIPEQKWKFWQHTDSHRISGIKSGVDRNVFAGDYDQLKKLTLK